MRYKEILSCAISNSGLSLSQIAEKINSLHGLRVTKSYLSQLQNGKTPPSEKLNHALATVLSKYTDVTYQELRIAAYREKIPDEVLEALVTQRIEEISADTVTNRGAEIEKQ